MTIAKFLAILASVSCATILLSSTGCLEPETDPVFAKVQDQVDAFSAGDVQRLVDNVSEDFKWYSLTADTLLVEVEGRDAFRENMEAYFDSRKPVSSTITNYVIHGNRMSFHESVSHMGDDGDSVSSSALGIYQVDNGEITRAWYFID